MFHNLYSILLEYDFCSTHPIFSFFVSTVCRDPLHTNRSRTSSTSEKSNKRKSCSRSGLMNFYICLKFNFFCCILGGVFVVLLCGLAFAVVIAIFEFCYNTRRSPPEQVSISSKNQLLLQANI